MLEPAAQEGQHLILYDGVCGLCNRAVAFILPRDPKGLFHYAWLQSEFARALLLKAGRNPDILDTICVLADYKSPTRQVLTRGRAALFILGCLETRWRFLKILDFLPTCILDGVYSLIARNRYRLFGKSDTCLMPNVDYANRFIDL
jgi:predicted DCC family thiol-disulfide oxidoreductase YuxK